MELKVLGCHGGETPRHRTSAFLLDDVLAIDAGALTRTLDLPEQFALEACVISHAHLDHVRDLATVSDNRCQAGCAPLVVAATAGTLQALGDHFFNDRLWPDFRRIPSPAHPTVRFVELEPERPIELSGFEIRAVLVNHTVESSGFVVRAADGSSLAYSGDTGPTERLWQILNAERDLRALLMEVSYPNAEQDLATISGHHTPKTLVEDLRKLRGADHLPTLLYHLKPAHQAAIERECAALSDVNLTVLNLGDQFVL